MFTGISGSYTCFNAKIISLSKLITSILLFCTHLSFLASGLLLQPDPPLPNLPKIPILPVLRSNLPDSCYHRHQTVRPGRRKIFL